MRRRLLAPALAVALLLPLFPAPAGASTVGPVYGFEMKEITIPSFASLSAYVFNNHNAQYAAYDFAGKYAGDLVYIDNSSRMDWFNPYNGSSGNISAPLTLLYQETPVPPGIEDQIDNEFMLDTPSDVALLYGNLTTSPGNVTVETVDLTNGTVRRVTTPVLMENNIQADYIGGGIVVVFNATAVGGEPTYMVNMYNGTAWPAGISVGIAAGNIYWVWQLHAFLDVQGTQVTQYSVEGNSLVQTARVWFNNSAVSSVSAVNGAIYNSGTGAVAFWEATNAGWYFLVASVSGAGELERAGSYAYFGDYVPYVEHYTYTSPYVWAVQAPPPAITGPTVLFSPFNNSTEPAPNLIVRSYGAGGWSNYLSENPSSTSTLISFNNTLVGAPTLGLGEFVWAWQQAPSGSGGSGGGGSSGPPGGGIAALESAASYFVREWYVWVLLIGIVTLAVVFLRRD